MADQEKEASIGDFCMVTGADIPTARHLLEASNWNLQLATQQYFDNQDPDTDMAGGDREDEADEDDVYTQPGSSRQQAPAAAASSSSASSAKPQPKKQTGSRGAQIRTLGDLSSSRDEDSEEEDEKDRRRDLFAGGEKSGLAVQDPGRNSGAGAGAGGRDLIQDILKRAAAEGGRRAPQEDTAAPPSRFSGSGQTLGSDTAASVPVPSTRPAPVAPTREPVSRSLTFWRNGFSVEDGPLMRYDDPVNREILEAIEAGRAPLSIMNVEPGQPADVSVYKRMDEDYIPPKKKFVPFSGQGNRLGSIVPGTSLEEAIAPQPAAAPAAAAAAPQTPTVTVDAASPTTNIQIRLGDGTRLVSRFNHTHTIRDVYDFVNASSPASRSRAYVLQTTFPIKELKEMEQTLKEAGLINAVVVQKWS
ncbi:hypothetical protein BZA77DRAFT_389824 [Pyronema omphalodes]|nr:hypothetical protein BZA77DRAFT_389824 [Pyronema omphalodes]